MSQIFLHTTDYDQHSLQFSDMKFSDTPFNSCNLEQKSPSVVKRVLEGQANADTVQCFYWPNEKPLCVSRGLELRLGSLLSVFISVSFAITLSLPLSLFIALLLSLQAPPFLTPHSVSAALFPLRSWRRKCHQIKLVGASNTACLPIPQSDSITHGSFSYLSAQNFIFLRYNSPRLC